MSRRPARTARSGPPPEPLRLASQRRDIRWCPDCGTVRSGAWTCGECGGSRRLEELGFSDLYEAYAGPLRRFVRRLAADRGLPESLLDTDGVVHDTFVVLLSGSGQTVRNPGAWLFTVARNLVSKAAVAQRRTAPGDPADHLDEAPAVWAALASPQAAAEDIRAAREVMRAIAGLPDHQRIATYLRQVQGWSLAEIGSYLDCAASTAGVHISRGTTKVRATLADRKEHRPRTAALADRDEHRPRTAYNITISGSQGVLIGDANIQRNDFGHVAGRDIHVHRRRRTARRIALAAAGTLTGGLLAATAVYALGMPWWLATVTAVAATVLVTAAVRWWRMRWVLAEGRLRWRRVRAWRHERRFNRWLRTGQPLSPPGDTWRH